MNDANLHHVPRRIPTAARLALGVLMIASGVVGLLRAAPAELHVTLWGRGAPLHVLGAIGELAVGALLVAPRPTRVTGAALLAWSAAMLVIRERVFDGRECDCMAGLGLGPRSVLAVWALVTLFGILALVRGGRRAARWLDPLQSATGIALLLGALVAADEVAGPGGPLQIAVLWDDAAPGTGRERARLLVMNTSGDPIDGVQIETSCPCVELGAVPAEIAAGGTAVVEVALVDRAPSTVPLVLLSGSLDGKPVRSRALLLPERSPGDARDAGS